MSTHLKQTFAHSTATDAFPAFVELVHWSRIILDEVHEYFAYGISAREKLRVLNSLRSDMWWGVSGTPYGSSDHVTRMFEFFTKQNVSSAFSPTVLKVFSEHCIRGHMYTWTSLKHTVHQVKLNANERLVLMANDKASMETRAHVCSGMYTESSDDGMSVHAQCAPSRRAHEHRPQAQGASLPDGYRERKSEGGIAV